MTTTKALKQLNHERLASLGPDTLSHGLQVLIDEIEQAQQFNVAQPLIRRSGEEYRQRLVTVYFSWVTNNRLMAYIIPQSGYDQPRLERLVIPEAGHRLYAHYKDGYQVNGGGYSKPFHILERMVMEAGKHIDVNIGVGHWQDFIKWELIA